LRGEGGEEGEEGETRESVVYGVRRVREPGGEKERKERHVKKKLYVCAAFW
jgi:hypothetical protein